MTKSWRNASIASFGLAAVLGLASCRMGPASRPPADLNLRAFGAVGDGIHDDGPALRKALDALADAGGGTLTVPEGSYALVTPVAKDFSGLARSVTIRGVAASTPITTRGSGARLSQGLELTSEFVVKTGPPNVALDVSGLTTLLIADVMFVGTADAHADAHKVLLIRAVSDATIRHSEFYGLMTQSEGGAIIHAEDSGLTIDQTAFLGTTGNSGQRAPVVLATNWRTLSLTQSVFLDYGTRPRYFGKLGLGAPYAWLMIGDAAPREQTTPPRVAVVRDVFMDEGAFTAIASIPDWYDVTPPPEAELIYVSDVRMNVSNLASAAVYVDRGARHVMVERAVFGFSRNAGPAVHVNNVEDVILDHLTCTEAVDRIEAGPRVQKLTITNSTCANVQSQAQTTNVFRSAPADGLVQHVRQRFLAALRTEPPAATHYDWSNRMLTCGADAACLAARENELTAALAQPAAR